MIIIAWIRTRFFFWRGGRSTCTLFVSPFPFFFSFFLSSSLSPGFFSLYLSQSYDVLVRVPYLVQVGKYGEASLAWVLYRIALDTAWVGSSVFMQAGVSTSIVLALKQEQNLQ